jgi:hypothetical protein
MIQATTVADKVLIFIVATASWAAWNWGNSIINMVFVVRRTIAEIAGGMIINAATVKTARK